MSEHKNQWVATVHRAMIASKRAHSSREIEELFGLPPGQRGVAKRLWAAKSRGWFSSEEYEGHLLYRAIEKQAPVTEGPSFERIGRGGQPWPSIWAYSSSIGMSG